jgi:UV DNA damage endonuclease
MFKPGLCCISLNLKDQGYSFQTMTFKRFSSLDRNEAITILEQRIINNLQVTNKCIKFCSDNNYNYRISSDLFPLITYKETNLNIETLPNYNLIEQEFENIKNTISDTNVRISLHPSEYNVLASTNQEAVNKTIIELNFYSWFFDKIGCEANHNSPFNLHVQNKSGSYTEIIDRFLTSFNKLDNNCKNRLVVECDDKVNCWSVKELTEIFYPKTNIPITFDYLHHKCNPNELSEQDAFYKCYETWDVQPLFHYSESADGNNPRKHADYAVQSINTYGLDIDLDFELKQKCKAIKKYMDIYQGELVCQI